MLSSRSLIRHRPRHAMVAVQVAVCMTALMGVGALALDGGVLLAERRHAQATADAAALAAAADLYRHYQKNNGKDTGGTARQSALTTASANGYLNDTINSTVTVSFPQDGYAEVIVKYNQQRTLSGIWGSARVPVSARAVARGAWVPSDAGLFLLAPTGSDALRTVGNGSLTVQNGGIIVNSNDPAAVEVNGNGTISATAVRITGNYNTTGNGIITTPTPNNITTGVPPTPDPLGYLPAPSSSALTLGSVTQSGTIYTLSPGIYGGLGGPTLPFDGSNKDKGITVILKQASAGNGGIYYLAAGGFHFAGANLQMDPNTSGGIMIYNAGTSSSDSLLITPTNNSGPINVSLSPPTSGIYKGIFYFQARSSPADLTLAGNGSFSITGTFYAPKGTISISGNGSATFGSQVIAQSMNLVGNGTVALINYPADPKSPDVNVGRTRIISLVE